jgi:hypothetical protein
MRKLLLLACLPVILAPTASFAYPTKWNCVAGSSDGAQGWSENYKTESAAEQRALRECEKVTTSDDCEIQQCIPHNGKS